MKKLFVAMIVAIIAMFPIVAQSQTVYDGDGILSLNWTAPVPVQGITLDHYELILKVNGAQVYTANIPAGQTSVNSFYTMTTVGDRGVAQLRAVSLNPPSISTWAYSDTVIYQTINPPTSVRFNTGQ